jgi:hypothetical protein
MRFYCGCRNVRVKFKKWLSGISPKKLLSGISPPEYTAKDGNKYDGWEKAIMWGYDKWNEKFSSDKYPYFPSYKYDSQGVKH